MANLKIVLMSKERAFKEKKNPILAMEAFILAHKMKTCPPLWTIDFFADAFKKYHDKLGLVDLESILGLKGVGKRGGALKPLLDEQRDGMLMTDLFMLTRPPLNFNISQAANMVARLLESIPEEEFNKTWINIKKIKATTIEDRYRKHWKDFFMIEPVIKIHDEWLKKNHVEFMTKFKSALSEVELKKMPRRKR